jgi:branched-subunit amino acid transport protein
MNVYIYIACMAGVTYLIRVLPLTLIRGEIRNRTLRSFLYYVPYVTLAVMTFPAILDATQSVWSALAAFLVAIALAYLGQSLFIVAISSSLTVLVIELVMKLLTM